ncbi:MAG: hypothetical protein KME17_05980 [Cyanosarcina radialis HA8281-LM2]|jgi:hypothetical protein|nr:hypothetical protein [Cyanosarcina radialis HA8281-LM2]
MKDIFDTLANALVDYQDTLREVGDLGKLTLEQKQQVKNHDPRKYYGTMLPCSEEALNKYEEKKEKLRNALNDYIDSRIKIISPVNSDSKGG